MPPAVGVPFTEFTYDNVGNTTSQRDAYDRGMIYTYTWSHGQYLVASSTDDNLAPATAYTEYTYDRLGRRTKLEDPLGNVTEWTYDALGRVVKEKTVAQGDREFKYDLAGNLTLKTLRPVDPPTNPPTEPSSVGYDYDSHGRIKNENWYYNGDSLVNTIEYTYDPFGRLTKVKEEENFEYDFEYDLLDRRKSASFKIEGLSPKIKMAGANYDSAGNRLAYHVDLLSTSGDVREFSNIYDYDNVHQLRSITQTQQSAGEGTLADLSNKHVELDYNAFGQLESLIRYLGSDETGTPIATTSFVYDNAGRYDTITHVRSGQIVNGYDLTYDGANRVDAIQVLSPMYSYESVDYSYDNRDQLKRLDYTADVLPDEDYSYDENGNRLYGDGFGGTLSQGAHNQLLDDGVYTYTYDVEGNRTRRALKADPTEFEDYEWDHRNRLVAVRTHSGGGND